jgi:hypothetical protein
MFNTFFNNVFNKRKLYLKIGIALLLAFLVSKGLNEDVFFANGPHIRPNLRGYYISKAENSILGKVPLLANVLYNLKTPSEKLEKLPLLQISKGVYAKEHNNVYYTEIHLNEMTFREYTFTINGKPMKLRVPVDQTPPTQQELEMVYKQ